MILAGDVGGTKTELAIFDDVSSRKIVKGERFLCKDYGSLEEIVQEFLSTKSETITHACFGIAGPIDNNTCFATNLPWTIRGDILAGVIGIPHVSLLNDLEANAWGIRSLHEDELYTISPGIKGRKGNQALISVGTGLGEAGLYFDGNTHHPFACEGGHCDFAPRDEEEIELLRYLKKKFKRVSYERILSGAGLGNLYRFFVEEKGKKEIPEVKQRMQIEDPAKIVYEYGVSGKCPICEKALRLFVTTYGSEAGNVALSFMSLGGLYIGGGVAPKILDSLKTGLFFESFKNKGRLSGVLASMRVEVILNPKTALLGAAEYADHKKRR